MGFRQGGTAGAKALRQKEGQYGCKRVNRDSREVILEVHVGDQLLHFGFYSICNVNILAFILFAMRTHWRLLSSGVI